jgi:hypothetical protein
MAVIKILLPILAAVAAFTLLEVILAVTIAVHC